MDNHLQRQIDLWMNAYQIEAQGIDRYNWQEYEIVVVEKELNHMGAAILSLAKLRKRLKNATEEEESRKLELEAAELLQRIADRQNRIDYLRLTRPKPDSLRNLCIFWLQAKVKILRR